MSKAIYISDADVTYIPSHRQSEKGYRRFDYKWRFKGLDWHPTWVYCKSAKDFQALISHWDAIEPYTEFDTFGVAIPVQHLDYDLLSLGNGLRSEDDRADAERD